MSDRKVTAQYARWIWAACLIVLSTSCLFAADQSLAEKAWNILDTGLHDDKKIDNRIQAVLALGVIPNNKKALDAAEQALDDPNGDVSRAAITALADMDARSSLPKIKALIDRADAKTVVTIAAALNQFKDPEAYDLYYELLTGKRKDGGSVLDGLRDKKGLEKMGAQTVIGFLPLGGIANGTYGYLKQNGAGRANLDLTAINALQQDPDPRVEKALIDASFEGKQSVQVAALRALAKRGDPMPIDSIESLIYSDKADVRYTAAATIVHLVNAQPRQRPS